jgi:hypothetical protein
MVNQMVSLSTSLSMRFRGARTSANQVSRGWEFSQSSFEGLEVESVSVGEGEGGVGVSLATVIMILSRLRDSSDGFDAVSVQMIEEITYKVIGLTK